ncbi:MAG: DUF202 domain-containing protein [Candidatus Manganitrophus sp.]|nr:MAG: DUF202 domain-containing protein [Candidatus Manganitrophus sp.]
MEKDDKKTVSAPLNVATHFAWLRTRMAAERTLEAWVRTAIALIGFGFTIVKFFERLDQIPGVATARDPNAPFYVGLFLIVIGVLALSISVWQYKVTVNYLFSEPFREGFEKPVLPHGWTPTLAIAVLLCLVGLLAFVSIFARAPAR